MNYIEEEFCERVKHHLDRYIFVDRIVYDICITNDILFIKFVLDNGDQIKFEYTYTSTNFTRRITTGKMIPEDEGYAAQKALKTALLKQFFSVTSDIQLS